MQFLYNLGTTLFGLAIQLAGPFHKKAGLLKSGRKKTFEHLRRDFDGNTSPVVWFHCASVGEFEQGRPVIELLKEQEPKTKIALTFFSSSGYELRKNYEHADGIYYLPLDTQKNAKTFLDILKPKAAVFVKYEVWPNFFQSMKNKGIPLIMISAIFRENQRFFKQNWWSKILRCVSRFYVQNEESKQLLKSIGVYEVQVIGDTRFDRVKQLTEDSEDIDLVKKFKGNEKLLLVGSSWPKDEEMILAFPWSHYPEWKVIFAPHEIHGDRITNLISKTGSNSIKYSEANSEKVSSSKILVIDNIGLLSRMYRYADIAYIGGGFGKGIHNILEAATFGVPIVFGPNYSKFQEANELAKRKGAFSISTQVEFDNRIKDLIDVEKERSTAGHINSKYVEENLGASQIIVKGLMKNIV